MRDRSGEDLAHRALLLRPVRQAVRRRGLPRARRQALLPRGLLRHVCAQVRWLQSGHYGELHIRVEQSMASGLLRLQGRCRIFTATHREFSSLSFTFSSAEIFDAPSSRPLSICPARTVLKIPAGRENREKHRSRQTRSINSDDYRIARNRSPESPFTRWRANRCARSASGWTTTKRRRSRRRKNCDRSICRFGLRVEFLASKAPECLTTLFSSPRPPHDCR